MMAANEKGHCCPYKGRRNIGRAFRDNYNYINAILTKIDYNWMCDNTLPPIMLDTGAGIGLVAASFFDPGGE